MNEQSATGAEGIPVLVADDSPAVCECAAQLLEPGCRVAGRFSSGEALLERWRDFRPRVIVLDISMSQLSGIDAARRLREEGCSAKIVFLTVHEDCDFINAAIGAGGAGYVFKSRMGSDLPAAIKTVLNGGVFVSNLLR